jgi:hypothetical protein
MIRPSSEELDCVPRSKEPDTIGRSQEYQEYQEY